MYKFLQLFLGFATVFSLIFEWGGCVLALVYLISKENWAVLITFLLLAFASKGITTFITLPAHLFVKKPKTAMFTIHTIVAIYNIFLFYFALNLVSPRLFLEKLVCGIIAFIAGTSGFFEILRSFRNAHHLWPVVLTFNLILPVLYILFSAGVLPFTVLAIIFIIAVFIATLKFTNNA